MDFTENTIKHRSPSSRQIFSLSWPIAMNAVLLQAILIIDTALVAPLGEEAVALTPMFVLLPLLRTSNVICGNVLRAGGDAAYAFKVHMGAPCLFTLPLSAVFVFYFKLGALWVFSLVLIEELIKAVPFHKRIYSGLWKRQLHTA